MNKRFRFASVAALCVCLAAFALSQDASTTGRPNILWIIAEDLGPDLGVYANPDVATPRLDVLGAQGVVYTNAFATAPVCSPSRSALFTGMYQTSIDAHHHRSHRSDGYRLPEGVRLLPERLREAGYFVARVTSMPSETDVSGSGKEDWNFTPPENVWDSSSWADLKSHQPFFAVVNLPEAHRPYRRGVGPTIDPSSVKSLPPYIADHPVAREDWAAYLETIQAIDEKVGIILDLVDEDGLRENTIVTFFGDNGREDFRGKSTAFDAGTRVPLIIRWPGQLAPETRSDQLISLIDLSASALALAGIQVPGNTHGVPFLVDGTAPRELIFTARDRIEEAVDRVRTVYDGRYRYIRNFIPNQPHLLDRAYYDRTNPVRDLMRDLNAKGQLTPEQAKVFSPERPDEELYDLRADPFELRNLSESPTPEHHAILVELRAELDRWMTETGDRGAQPEDPSAQDLGVAGRGRGRGRGTGASGARGGRGARMDATQPDVSQ